MKNLDTTTKKLWLAETIFCFLIDAKNGKTIDEICNHFGKERREINAALKVLDGKNKIQAMVDSDNKTKFLIQELNAENEVLNLNWFRDNGVIA
jgi:molybdopterin converting factor small subunit